MASSTQVKNKLNALQQSHMSSTLRNTLFNIMPLLYFAFGRDGQMSDGIGLGRPKTGVFVSGVETAKARRESILGSGVYEPIVQTSLPASGDGKVMGMYDSLPTRSSWDTLPTSSYFTRPRGKWTEWSDPYKCANKEIRRTRAAAKNEIAAWEAIGSMFLAETRSVMAVHENRWNQMLWGTTGSGAPSNEDAVTWDAIHKLSNALGTSNTYWGVDRSASANAYWRGADTSGYTGGSDFETLINYCKFDLGFQKKGFDLDLLLVDATNFKRAKIEAKTKGHTLMATSAQLPYGQFGFKRELVKIDNTFIVYDPECPSGEVAALNLATWTIAVHPDANFKVTGPDDQSKIEGGDDAQTGVIRTETLMVCELPSMNAYFTGLT